jgi:hypothetical protein
MVQPSPSPQFEPAAPFADDLGAELVLLRVEHPATDVLRHEHGRTIAYLDELEDRAELLAADYLDRVGTLPQIFGTCSVVHRSASSPIVEDGVIG